MGRKGGRGSLAFWSLGRLCRRGRKEWLGWYRPPSGDFFVLLLDYHSPFGEFRKWNPIEDHLRDSLHACRLDGDSRHSYALFDRGQWRNRVLYWKIWRQQVVGFDRLGDCLQSDFVFALAGLWYGNHVFKLYQQEGRCVPYLLDHGHLQFGLLYHGYVLSMDMPILDYVLSSYKRSSCCVSAGGFAGTREELTLSEC